MDDLKPTIKLVDKTIYGVNDKSVELLDLEYNRNLKESAIEMAYSLIDIGMVKDLRKK